MTSFTVSRTSGRAPGALALRFLGVKGGVGANSSCRSWHFCQGTIELHPLAQFHISNMVIQRMTCVTLVTRLTCFTQEQQAFQLKKDVQYFQTENLK